MRGHVLPLCCACAVALIGCSRGPTAETSAPGAAPDLATITVAASVGPDELQLDGVVEAVEQATLSAQTAGRVAGTLVDADDAVRKGQLLLRLRAAEQVSGLAQAEAAVQSAAARDAQARAQFERIDDMYLRKVVARATYDEALAARDAAAANLAAARAGLAAAREGVAYTELRAPFDGVVTSREVDAGEAVAPGTVLLTVSGRGPLRVVAAIPQRDAAAVRAQGKAVVYLGDRPVAADRVTVFPAADAQSGTVRVRAELPAGVAGLVPGMHAKLGLVTGERARTSVPRTAVVERSELRAVYVVLPDGTVALRQVRLGRTDGDAVEVLAGLASGERVATDPASAAMMVRGGRRDE